MSDVTKWSLLRDNNRALRGRHRAANCLRNRLKNEQAKVTKTEQGKARYKNLRPCGSVWVCPLCGMNISVARAAEISLAVGKWQAGGGKIAMVTYTHRHHKKTALVANLELVRLSYAKMQAHRTYRTLRVWSHQIQTLEITWGVNGWHVHIHTLIFWKGDLPENLEQKLYELWSKYVVAKAGIGVKLSHPSDKKTVGRYMSKVKEWGLGEELTLEQKKRGGDGYLDFLLDGDYDKARAYAIGTAGRNKLTWSRGSKEYFGIGEKSDSELAELPDGNPEFATIPDYIWAWLSNPYDDKRPLGLELAELAGSEEEYLMMLESERNE